VAGRLLRDYEPTPVTVINKTLAERYWHHQSALGKHVYFLKPSQEVENSIDPGAREIVGVVADVDMYGPRSHPWPFMYIPYDQNPVAPLSVAIRASNAPEALRILTETLQQIDSDMPLFHTGTAREYAAEALAGDYFDVYLLAIFAAVAMLLSASGIFAVLAHSVTQRKAEFGVRMAIGASRRNILLLVLRESFKLGVAGLVIGTCVAVFLTRIMGALIVRSSLWDAAIYGVAVILVAAAIFAASLIPALRAALIDPMAALRAE
jgi:putative ABC transport system permease protein